MSPNGTYNGLLEVRRLQNPRTPLRGDRFWGVRENPSGIFAAAIARRPFGDRCSNGNSPSREWLAQKGKDRAGDRPFKPPKS
ncbi:hypothetical protein [Oxynema aestuarii]|uniref:Uncharacterized protein n=1 Tax=Oxynema aestuarii AP17 TaxID=2064643 RepID=A0A6H1U236_9CYAN|nr:hypothetical protein [Oxynema aestuarii]QIZ72715.1 hypothetical protein HCG48_20700 [Oxynema aestuarii AP17]